MNLSTIRQDRVVRVFISSTFLDMHPEREELVKHTFPRLRAFCESHGVTLIEVDLRWGITEEEAEKGMVLPICLAEIDNCRPFFVGILGDRYGKILDQYPDDLIEQEPWLKAHSRKSITELEILHGALNNAEASPLAFFYFRDSTGIAKLPSAMPSKASEPANAEAQEKLNNLKKRIAQSGFPVKYYSEPSELGKLVFNDLRERLQELYPETALSDPFELEAATHQSTAERLSQVYVSRQDYYGRLDEHVAGTQLPLVVAGQSGVGKSALLANWTQLQRKFSLSTFQAAAPVWAHLWRTLRSLHRIKPESENEPKRFILTHFIGATAQSADWAAMLRRIMVELKKQFGISLEIPEAPNLLRTAFANWLHLAADKGKIILIIDGLDHLEDRGQALDLAWLPEEIPANIRLILSTAEGRPLDELRRRHWPIFEIAPLKNKERKKFIAAYLGQFRKKLASAAMRRITSSRPCTNPLYLKILLGELRVFGRHELLRQTIDDYLAADSAKQLFKKVLLRFEKDYERNRPELVRDSMRLLWAARQGLREDELLELLGTGESPLPNAVWSPLLLAVQHSLVNRSDALSFFHQDLREAVEQLYFSHEQEKNAAHQRLADYFLPRNLSVRKIEELPWQLAATRSWSQLSALFAEPEFLHAAWKTNPFEVKSYWTMIEKNSVLRMAEAYQAVLKMPPNYSVCLWEVCTLLQDAGHVSQALHLSQYLAGQAQETNNEDDLQASLSLQAALLKSRGDLDGAMTCLREQEQICLLSSNLGALATSLGNQGVILWTRGDHDGATTCFLEEEMICRQMGDLVGLSANRDNLGILAYEKMDLVAAMNLFREQEKICRQLGDLSGLQKSFGHQSAIHRHRGEFERAFDLLQAAEAICRKLGDADGIQACLGHKAKIQEDLGNYDGAMELLDEKEKICRKLNAPFQLAVTLLQKVDLFLLKLNQPDAALPFAQEAHILATQYGLMKLQQNAQERLNVIASALSA